MSSSAHIRKRLQGFLPEGSSCGGASCDNTRLICFTVGDKNYLVEVDSCGNQVTDAKPLGTCSVRPDGTLFPLDANGNQIIDINEIDMDINSVVQEGSAITFTAEDGTQVVVDICAVVAANCNSPMIVNPDGSVTYTDNAGTVTTIPAPVPETVTTFVLNADGSLTYTSEDGTVTNVPAPTVSALAEVGGVVTHTAGDGTAVSFDICAIVAANCNSPMVLNADGSVTYTDNAGTVTTIPAPVPETVTTFVLNADGSLTYTSEDGTVTNVPAPTVSALAVAGSVVTHTAGDGTPVNFDICAIVAANCNSPMVLNADGSVTYTDNAGTVTTIPAPVHSSLVLNPDGSLTHTSGDGTVTNVPAPTVSALAVAGSVVTHTAGDGTPVNFDICAIVAANCNSPMVLNADGSVTYTDNAGTVTTIPAPTNSSLVADVAAGTFTHVSGDGTSTVVDICAMAQGCAPSLVAGPGPNEYTFDNGYGVTQVINVNEIDMDINSMTVTGSVLNWTAEDGTTGNVDICAIVAANCNSPMVLNADGSVSYTDNAGNTTVIPAPTVSTLVANPDGSYTHTSGDGTVQDIAAPVVSQLLEDAGVVTHTSGDGTVVSFDICAIVAANCNSPMVLNADGSVTYTDNAGVTTTIPAPAAGATSSFTSNGDGTTTHDDGNGNVTANIQEDIVDGGSNLVAADGVTINPLLDCNNAPIDVTTETFVANSEPGLYRQIFLPNCPDSCEPPARTKTTIAEIACDPTGKTWKAEVGEAGWTPVKRGFCRLPIVTDLAIAPSFNVLNATTNDVLVTKDIDFPNPTCDPVTYVVDIGAHMEGYINNAENGGASFFGIWINFDGFGVIHHTPGQGNTTLDYHDVSGQFFHRPELTVEVPPKTTVTKTLEVIARVEGGYEGNVANTATALSSFAGLRAVGTTDCDLG